MSRGGLTSGITGREAQSSAQLSFVEGDGAGGMDTASVITVGVGGADDADGSGIGGRMRTVEGVSDTISEIAGTGSLREAFSCWAKEFPARKARFHMSAKLRCSELAVC